ncbi:uncharacterized protein LOC127256185 [Andrographis paniculata]|uniref:uncharacterized protein LOC127256185 n=1 Tax=Andrographis paniculata TaxID=175694 RepID=UPI0021E8166F|nr:uncharacterized protein LOC127256185 [Andrographis paniculata]
MCSSDSGGGLVDCSVGSIVWVRRRNGSWWPGKILGPEELSSSLVTSPRSGTPVKLLGREDASVDWYNLEKSKRVKAFRCGEFDDCIERAEAAQGMPPKKREKYARREDAILHALELERQLLEKKYGKVTSVCNGGEKKSPEAVNSGSLECGDANHNDPRSDQLSERLGSSPAEKNAADQIMLDETVREGNQQSGDDESAGILPRMRGLQDFGLSTTPPMREELPGAVFRAKRSRYAYLPSGSGDYSNDNQTISSQMDIRVSQFEGRGYPVDRGEDHESGSTEDTETDSSETDSLELDSDGLSDGSYSIELQPKYPWRIGVQEDHGSISSTDDLDELPFAESTSTGASKWHLKGQRNNQGLGKRSLDRADAEFSGGYVTGRNSNWSNSGFKADYGNKRFRSHISRYGSTGLGGITPYEKIDSEGLGWSNQSAANRGGGYWEALQQGHLDPILDGRHHFGGRFMLIDVDLKVDANNYRRDVPMTSVVSKLNGHAMIGHPIKIEALENGSTENLVSGRDHCSPEPLEAPAQLPSVWRTGRRTANARVPRPFLSSLINGGDGRRQAAPFIYQDQRSNTAPRNMSPNPGDRKLSRTSPSSGQKIRALSSISEKHQSDLRCGCRDYQAADGAGAANNKRENAAATTIACIPVNLVFSRLHEELVGRRQQQ